MAKKKTGATKRWLAAKAKRDAGMAFLAAAVLAPIAAVVLFFTWYTIFVFIGVFLFHAGLAAYAVAAAWVVWSLLFVGNWTTNREYLDQMSFEMDGVTRSVRVAASLTGYGGLNFLAGPKSFHSFVKILTTILFIGPRTCDLIWAQFQRGVRLSRLDASSCSRIISTLCTAGQKVSLSELFHQHDDLDPARVLAELRDVDGVLFLQAEPPGLSLSTDLREELIDWRMKQREAV